MVDDSDPPIPMSERNVIHNFSHEAMGTRFWIRIADEDRSYAERAAE